MNLKIDYEELADSLNYAKLSDQFLMEEIVDRVLEKVIERLREAL